MVLCVGIQVLCQWWPLYKKYGSISVALAKKKNIYPTPCDHIYTGHLMWSKSDINMYDSLSYWIQIADRNKGPVSL